MHIENDTFLFRSNSIARYIWSVVGIRPWNSYEIMLCDIWWRDVFVIYDQELYGHLKRNNIQWVFTTCETLHSPSIYLQAPCLTVEILSQLCCVSLNHLERCSSWFRFSVSNITIDYINQNVFLLRDRPFNLQGVGDGGFRTTRVL